MLIFCTSIGIIHISSPGLKAEIPWNSWIQHGWIWLSTKQNFTASSMHIHELTQIAA